jgi:hypothetical protein
MFLRRESAVGALILCLVLLGPVPSRAQSQGVPARIAQLEAQLNQALATIAQLQAALNSEAAARMAADAALEGSIGTSSGVGVSQADLQAAIAGEASARSAGDAALQSALDNEASARTAFDSTLSGVSALAPYVTVEAGTLNDLAGPHVIFSGANIHIRSGHFSGNSYTQNGLGNLVLGYNEPSDSGFPAERAGSHNVVVGPNHRYDFGVGLVVGGSSRLGSDAASVSGGFMNVASGMFSSVGAGLRNEASGEFASISGGADNIASAAASTVSAGQMNQATADLSAVSGGFNNVASGVFSTVGGGSDLTNSAPFSFIP